MVHDWPVATRGARQRVLFPAIPAAHSRSSVKNLPLFIHLPAMTVDITPPRSLPIKVRSYVEWTTTRFTFLVIQRVIVCVSASRADFVL